MGKSKDLSIKYKLIMIGLFTTGAVLLFTGLALIINEYLSFRNALINNLTIQIKIIADNSTAALSFDDEKAAKEILKALKASPNITYAVTYSGDGSVFATYKRADMEDVFFQPPAPESNGYHIRRNHLDIFRQIVLDNESIGSVYIQSDLRVIYNSIKFYTGIVGVIIVVALVVAFIMISKLQQTVTKPILLLRQTTEKIAKGNFSAKAEIKSKDEIGFLAESFNMMTNKLLASREELVNAKDYVDNIIKSMTDMLIVVNPDATIRNVNQAAYDLLGYKEVEFVGKPIGMIFAGDDAFKETGIADLINRGFISGSEKLCMAKDGAEIPVLFSGSVMRDKNGRVQGFVCVASDITERKRLEEEKNDIQIKMAASSKLASLGEIATGVAHEINQPLTYISSFIQDLNMDLKDDAIDKAVLKKDLNVSYKQIKRINDIIQHLRTFGRSDDLAKDELSLETVLDNTLLIMGERMRLRNIDVIRDIEPNLPMVIGNANQLEQVFINLFQNAISAFVDKSKKAEIRIDIFLSNIKDFVIINVVDTGHGMDKKTLGRLFEPFFTTKEVGQGTGVGLSIVYGIVKEHKGSIVCESVIGKGSKFTIKLPTHHVSKR